MPRPAALGPSRPEAWVLRAGFGVSAVQLTLGSLILFLDPPRPAQAPAPSAVLVHVPALTCRLLVFPVLGPAHVGRRLTQDLGNQRYLGAFARLSVIRSLLNLRWN